MRRFSLDVALSQLNPRFKEGYRLQRKNILPSYVRIALYKDDKIIEKWEANNYQSALFYFYDDLIRCKKFRDIFDEL